MISLEAWLLIGLNLLGIAGIIVKIYQLKQEGKL